MKQTINIGAINDYLFNKHHTNNILDNVAVEHGQLLFGVHADICASQQNNKKDTGKMPGKRISVYNYN